ncbi:hypothetical protein TWF730_006127 [Orbilia blumenaviensis]|uniref:Ankyrin n=1 Tax=Orbilia blumenaviensis TaxID=1796055 RepID=A0AAV9TX02_9PEZI
MLESGADITLKDIHGSCAISRAHTPEVPEPLPEYCPPSHLNNMTKPRDKSILLGSLTEGQSGVRRMDAYEETQNIRFASLLIDAGADINLGTVYGASPLSYMVRWDYPTTTKFLLDSGSDVNSVCKNGRTVVMETVQYDARASLAVILSEPRDFDFALKDRGSWNMLHYLAWFGSIDMLKLFEAVDVAGTDADSGVIIADSKTCEGHTPMDLAIDRLEGGWYLDRVGEEVDNDEFYDAIETPV